MDQIQRIEASLCFQEVRYPKLMGGNLEDTSFYCSSLEPDGNLLVGGATSDSGVKSNPFITGTKPIILSMNPDGSWLWAKLLDYLDYESVTSVYANVLDQNTNAVAAIYSITDDICFMQFDRTNGDIKWVTRLDFGGITGIIGPQGLLMCNDKKIFAVFTMSNIWAIVSFYGSQSNPLVNFQYFASEVSMANTIIAKPGYDYLYIGGYATSQSSDQYASITTIDSDGDVLYNYGLFQGQNIPNPYSIQSLDMMYDGTVSQYCQFACLTNGVKVILAKFIFIVYSQQTISFSVEMNSYSTCLAVATKSGDCNSNYYFIRNQNNIRIGYLDSSFMIIDTYFRQEYQITASNYIRSGFYKSEKAYFLGNFLSVTDNTIPYVFNKKVGFVMTTEPQESDLLILKVIESPNALYNLTSLVWNDFSMDFDPTTGYRDPTTDYPFFEFSVLEGCTDIAFTYSCQYSSNPDNIFQFNGLSKYFRINTLSSSSTQYIGNYSLTLVALMNNGQTAQTTFNLEIKQNCISATTSIVPSQQSIILHEIDQGVSKVYNLVAFTSNPVGCDFIYTLSQINGTSLSSIQSFNNNSMTVEILPTTQTFQGIYQFALIGQLVDNVSNQILVDLFLKIVPVCGSAIITPTNRLSYLYYVDSGAGLYLFAPNWPISNSSCGTVIYSIVQASNNSTSNLDFISLSGTNEVIMNTQEFAFKGQSQLNVPFGIMTISNALCGGIDFTLKLDNVVITSDVIVDASNNQILIDTTNFTLIGVKVFQLIGTSYQGGVQASTTFTITFLDPCMTVLLKANSSINYFVQVSLNQLVLVPLPVVYYDDVINYICDIEYIVTDDAYISLPASVTYSPLDHQISVFDDTSLNDYQLDLVVQGRINGRPTQFLNYTYLILFQVDCNCNKIDVTDNTTVAFYQLYTPNYVIDYSALFHQHFSTCPITIGMAESYVCKFLNGSSCNGNTLFTQNPLSPILTINSSDKTNVGMHTIVIQISSQGLTGYLQLQLGVSCDCRCTVITSYTVPNGSYDKSNGTQTYIHHNLAWQSSDSASCPIIYQLFTPSLTAPNPMFQIDSSTGDIKVSVSSSTTAATYLLIVVSQVGSLTETKVFKDFQIKITNICSTTANVNRTVMPAQNYTIGDPILTYNFLPWTAIPSYLLTSNISHRGTYVVRVFGYPYPGNVYTSDIVFNLKLPCYLNQVTAPVFNISSTVTYNIGTPQMDLIFAPYVELNNGAFQGQLGMSSAFRQFYLLIVQTCQIQSLTASALDVAAGYTDTSPLYQYFIGSGEMNVDFNPFTQYQVCNEVLTYTLEQENSDNLPDFITLFNPNLKRIVINSNNKLNAIQSLYNLKIIASVNTPSGLVESYLIIPLKMRVINNSPPQFVYPLTELTIQQGTSLQYNFPDVMDLDGDEIDQVQLSLGLNIILKDLSLEPKSAQYKLKVIVIEKLQSNNQTNQTNQTQNNQTNQTQNNQTTPNLVVITDPSKISEDLTAYIKSINLEGLVTIQFNQQMKVPSDYSKFHNYTGTLFLRRMLQSRIDIGSHILLLKLKTRDGEYLNNVKFTWRDLDELEVTFLANSKFIESSNGLAIKHGYTIKKSIPKQLRNDALSKQLKESGQNAVATLKVFVYGSMALNLAMQIYQQLYILQVCFFANALGYDKYSLDDCPHTFDKYRFSCQYYAILFNDVRALKF
eukprot:403343797